ncbi:acyltransferase [Candidatus Kuenenia sp.]|uniref:acyltransferase n=1 Tax=Candidatus Kuenenia sp. TaxID=2499824 RepID=UPI003AF5D6A7
MGKWNSLWIRFWMRFAGLSLIGRIATRLATWFAPPYHGRCYLAYLNPKGYISPSATIYHSDLHLGNNVFIGDRVIIFQDKDGGSVKIGRNVCLYGDINIQSGSGGNLEIGERTYIQPRCQFSAYKSSIQIGCGVSIAANCAFYPYNHGVAPGIPIGKQPLQSKGGIIIGDDSWLGFGVIVLDGVRIGNGAVVGAGSVVTHDIPDNAIAAGVPARVIKMRNEMVARQDEEKNGISIT